MRKNNAKLTPSFRQVLFPKKSPVLTSLTSPTFKGGFEHDFLKFKKRQFRTFSESFEIIPYSLFPENRCLFFEYNSGISFLIISYVIVNFKMNLAPGWVLFSYTLLRKEPHIIPRKSPKSIGSIYSIPIDQLHPHPDNPFGIRDDPSMLELIESVKKHGVMVPAIARPKPDGGYELVAGHRRQRASQLAGLDSMPVIVMNLDDNDTIIQLVDSNIQRENILPSERAKAYKLRMEAIKKKAGRPQKEGNQNSPKISANFRSDDSIGGLAGVSGDTIRNYISLTNLIPELMEMVDEKEIALSPAYQIAALPQESQDLLLDTIESEQATPSLSQAQRIRKLSQCGKLDEDSMLQIMMEQKKPERNDITLSGEKLRKYFPRSYSPQKIEETIFKLLEAWMRKRQRDNSR